MRARVSVVAQGLADAGSMAAHQVELELPEVALGDHHLGEVAEPGVHPVDDRSFRHRRVHHGARAADGFAGGGSEGDLAAVAGDAFELGEPEALAVEKDRGLGQRGWGSGHARRGDYSTQGRAAVLPAAAVNR